MDENKDLSRKEQREEIVKILYSMDITKDSPELTEVKDYVKESILGVVENMERIDEILITNLQNWKINRLSYVDRAILRFAVYELYYTSTPFEIVINEALNLVRKYSDEGDNKTVGFINKVLDNIKVYLKK